VKPQKPANPQHVAVIAMARQLIRLGYKALAVTLKSREDKARLRTIRDQMRRDWK
jgi:hypothetical protein